MYKLSIILILLLNTFHVSAQNEWKLKTEKDGIKVYISTVSDSKFKAVKVDCELNTTLSQLVMVLLDVKNGADWVDHTKSCMLLKQVSPSELYYYSEVSIPWPVQNRDFVAHLTVRQDPETKVVTMDGPSVNGMVPVKNGIVRVRSSKGLWVLTPLAGNKVRVIYTLQVDPGGSVPAWLVNMLAGESPLKSFQNLKKELKKPDYQHADLDFIKD